MSNDIVILECCHKMDFYVKKEGYFPIQVGKSLSKITLPMQGDDEGENISIKNPNFCELTAHYWYWKNCEHAKYVGLCHYRRFFDFDKRMLGRSFYIVSPTNPANIPSLFMPNIQKLLLNYDILLPRPIIYPYSLTDDYKHCHISDDLSILKSVIADYAPDYMESFDYIMDRNNKLSHYNMFITRCAIFENYSEWLFRILFETERRIHISEYPIQARVFGYMSERLLNIYVHKHKLKVKYLPICWIVNRKQESWLKCMVRNIRNDIVFLMFGRRSLGYTL